VTVITIHSNGHAPQCRQTNGCTRIASFLRTPRPQFHAKKFRGLARGHDACPSLGHAQKLGALGAILRFLGNSEKLVGMVHGKTTTAMTTIAATAILMEAH